MSTSEDILKKAVALVSRHANHPLFRGDLLPLMNIVMVPFPWWHILGNLLLSKVTKKKPQTTLAAELKKIRDELFIMRAEMQACADCSEENLKRLDAFISLTDERIKKTGIQ